MKKRCTDGLWSCGLESLLTRPVYLRAIGAIEPGRDVVPVGLR